MGADSDYVRRPYHKAVIATRQSTERAVDLRGSMTAAERYLWSRLKNRQLGGLRFRRQHPLGPYIADFYCDEVALVVEIDGASHQGRGLHDVARDAWMRERRIEVIRFTGRQVMREMDVVLRSVFVAAEKRRAGLERGDGSGTPPPSPTGEVASAAGG